MGALPSPSPRGSHAALVPAPVAHRRHPRHRGDRRGRLPRTRGTRPTSRPPPRSPSPSTPAPGWPRSPTPRSASTTPSGTANWAPRPSPTCSRPPACRMMRYPGGSYARHLPLAGPHRARRLRRPRTPTSTLHGLGRAGPAPSRWSSPTTAPAPPQEAADWVRYANVTKGYGVEVLGDRQRELRQRPLRRRAGRPTTTPTRARPRTPTRSSRTPTR